MIKPTDQMDVAHVLLFIDAAGQVAAMGANLRWPGDSRAELVYETDGVKEYLANIEGRTSITYAEARQIFADLCRKTANLLDARHETN